MAAIDELPPDRAFEQHRRAWEQLADGISTLRRSVTDDPSRIAPPAQPGELVIIGSGIDSIGFSLGDEALIANADKVLYCVADPATVVWLRQLRPDALDLYVLYADDKVRYTTYMEMAEAQLYWVRQGLRVVVIFYGHPGIFVLSTHRAIQIARREGHRAVMRAGVSALDTLCADLGVDPSHPGLQTHEATDCLIRRRRIRHHPARHSLAGRPDRGARLPPPGLPQQPLLVLHLVAGGALRFGLRDHPLHRIALSGHRSADRCPPTLGVARSGPAAGHHRVVDVLHPAPRRRPDGPADRGGPGYPSARPAGAPAWFAAA
jgi:hypothetical protein